MSLFTFVEDRLDAFRSSLAERKGRSDVPWSVSVFFIGEEISERFPGARPLRLSRGKYSLIVTCRNELKSSDAFLDSILGQTLLPDEVIVCDAGSDDGTLESLLKWADREDRFRVKVLSRPGFNIAKGRNEAFSEVRNDIVLITDFGVELDKNWGLYLYSSFFSGEDLEFAMGYYRPVFTSAWHSALSYFLLPRWDFLDPNKFYASARSMGIKKTLFDRVGGFPEYLRFAGEDSLFNFNIRKLSPGVGFVPEAFCEWRMEESLLLTWRNIYRYAYGDGETGFLFWDYYVVLVKKVLVLVSYLLLTLVCYKVSKLLVLLPGFLFLRKVYVLIKEYGVFLNNRSGLGLVLRTGMLFYFLSAQTIGFLVGAVKGLFHRKGR